MLLGIAAVVLGLAKAHAALVGGYDLTESTRFRWALGYIAVAWFVAYAVGLPDCETRRQAGRSALLASVVAPLLVAFAQLVVGTSVMPRFVIGLSVPLLALVFLSSCWLRRRGWHAESRRDRVFAVLDGSDVETLRSDLTGPLARAASLAGFVSSGELSGAHDLAGRLDAARATVLVLGRQALTDQAVVAGAASAHEGGMRVRALPEFYEEWIGKVPISELERSMLLFDIGEVHRPMYEHSSRVIDVIVGCIGVLFLAVVVPIVYIGNLIGNRGPLLFRQPRAGRGEREFNMIKFRSMLPGPSTGQWTQVDDQRITKFGRFLRLTHLDELPQVVNILRGDLSVVGPRPEQPKYVAELAERIPFYRLRHLVRPGLTGWAQVNYPYGADERDALEKLQYEFWYLRHQSVTLDLRIIARTIRSVIGFQGR